MDFSSSTIHSLVFLEHRTVWEHLMSPITYLPSSKDMQGVKRDFEEIGLRLKNTPFLQVFDRLQNQCSIAVFVCLIVCLFVSVFVCLFVGVFVCLFLSEVRCGVIGKYKSTVWGFFTLSGEPHNVNGFSWPLGG